MQNTSELERFAMEHLSRIGPTSTAKLHNTLKGTFPTLTEQETASLVTRLAREGKIKLEKNETPANSLFGYLHNWEPNAWFYSSLAVALASLTLLLLGTLNSFVIYSKWIVGVLLVAFVPGCAAVHVLYPKPRALDGFHLVVLSIALSLVLDSIVGAALSWSSWGINSDSVVMSLSVLVFILGLVAIVRRYSAQR
jgi:hypothetical protein